MKYDPDIHHRRSIRLREYDYSAAGAYFVTICTQERECLFGEINNGEMFLNDAGRIVKEWWYGVSDHFENVVLDEYVIMPNHFHGIVVMNDDKTYQPNTRQSRLSGLATQLLRAGHPQ